MMCVCLVHAHCQFKALIRLYNKAWLAELQLVQQLLPTD